MFKLNKYIFIFLLALLTPEYTLAEKNKYPTEQNYRIAFKKSQNCYTAAVSKEDWEDALLCSNLSLEFGKKLFDSKNPNIAALTHNYGLMQAKNGSYRSAANTLKKAGKLYKKINGKNSESEGWLLLDLAETQVFLNGSTAAKNYKKSFEILSKFESFTPWQRARVSLDSSTHLSGSTTLTKKSLEIAFELAEIAHNYYYENHGYENKDTALSAFIIGKLHYLNGDYKLALEFLEKSLLNFDIGKYAHAILIDIHTINGNVDLINEHQEALGKVNSSQNETNKFQPVFIKDPTYPKIARKFNRNGYAIVSFTITENGSVKDVELFEEYPKNFGFGREALKVANQLKFLPKTENGKAVKTFDVRYKYTFMMREEKIRMK